MSVLQASPLAQGLFHKVIGQSGARFIPIPDRTQARWGIPSAEAWGETLAQKISGADDASLHMLRELDAKHIMDQYTSHPEIMMNFETNSNI